MLSTEGVGIPQLKWGFCLILCLHSGGYLDQSWQMENIYLDLSFLYEDIVSFVSYLRILHSVKPTELKIKAIYTNEKLILPLSLTHTHAHSHTLTPTMVLDFGSFWLSKEAAVCFLLWTSPTELESGGLSRRRYFIWVDSCINCSVVSD